MKCQRESARQPPPHSRAGPCRGTLELMSDTAGAGRPIDLTNQELSSVEQYRRLRQTSVLVILFTDIKGFTSFTERRGDRHALELLKHHDEILVATIEEDGGGLVVKHIGDSIMAVFSEPSTAVERALRIQERIRAYNAEHPDEEPLQVRIGLHMGQVAVENQTQLDLFGRHVNRASRVEGLADAGQIFLTYPVFDSARGWIATGAAGALKWKSHGTWMLKGITEPVVIYEVVDQRHAQPRRPGRAAGSAPCSPCGRRSPCSSRGRPSPLAQRGSRARRSGSSSGPRMCRPSWTRSRPCCSRATRRRSGASP